MTSKVYRTAANDFAVAENCVGEILTWTPRVEDTSEGGLGCEPYYEDTARPRYHRKYIHLGGDAFRCDDCGHEKRDMFLAAMQKIYIPAMVDGIFKSSQLFAYLKSSENIHTR